jgi:alanyl-tRNA synthetase
MAAPKQKMSSAIKAAAVLIALGKDSASEVYKHLHDDEIEELSYHIAKIDKLNSKIASFEIDDLFTEAKQIGKIKLITKKFEDTSTDELRNIADMIKEKSPDYVAVLASVAEDKINFVAVCGADAIKYGADAGKLIKDVAKVTGGGGGGRFDSATAGGKDVQKLDQAFLDVADILASMLK